MFGPRSSSPEPQVKVELDPSGNQDVAVVPMNTTQEARATQEAWAQFQGPMQAPHEDGTAWLQNVAACETAVTTAKSNLPFFNAFHQDLFGDPSQTAELFQPWAETIDWAALPAGLWPLPSHETRMAEVGDTHRDMVAWATEQVDDMVAFETGGATAENCSAAIQAGLAKHLADAAWGRVLAVAQHLSSEGAWVAQ